MGTRIGPLKPREEGKVNQVQGEEGNYRIERDSLGEVKVPKEAYYGAQTQRARENFPISGLVIDRVFIESYVLIKKAAALVNCELGMLSEEQRDAIVAACDEVLAGKFLDQWVVDVYQAGAGTSFNMNTNEVIANRANEIAGHPERGTYPLVHPNDHVNMAQSTNDTFPTAIRLTCLRMLPALLSSLDSLIQALGEKGEEFAQVITTGRTHNQDATPITLGQVFTAFADTVEKARQRLVRASGELYHLNLGGTAVGTGLNTHPDYRERVALKLAELTGLDLKPARNYIEIAHNIHDFAEFAAALRCLALDLLKIGIDLRHMNAGPTSGIYEIVLPTVQPGSSIMPGKINPSMVEMLNQVCFQVVGLATTVDYCTTAGEHQLNVMMPVVGFNLTHMLKILTNAITAFTERCVRGIRANQERCRHFFESSLSLATVLNPLIGYNQAARIVKQALAKGKPILREVVEEGVLTEEQVRKIFTPDRLTRPGFITKEDL